MYAVKIKGKAFGENIEFYIGNDTKINTYHGMFSGGLMVAFKRKEAKPYTKSEAEFEAELYGGVIEKLS